MDNNDVAMCLSGLYQAGRIRADNQEFHDSGDWLVVPYPQFENRVKEVSNTYYGHYYMVNMQSTAGEQEAAWKFVGYMLEHPEEYLMTVGLIQPTKKLMASDSFAEIPYSKVFADDMEKAHIVYYGENSAKMNELLKEAVESVMMSGVAPQQALSSLRTKAQELLE